MKCINCGSEIPNISGACPFCGTVNTYNENESVLPVTPETPVLPKDQDMVTEPISPAVPVGSELGEVGAKEVTPVPPVESTPVPPVPPVESAPVPPVPPVESAPVPPVESTPVPPTSESDVVPIPPLPKVEESPVPTPPTPPVSETPVNTVINEPNPISNQGVIEDGAKISSAPVKEPKKKSFKLIILLIIIVIALGGGGFGVYYYTSQYNSANKRIDGIVNGVFNFASSIKSENIELASGEYNTDISLNYAGSSISAKANGKYAYDLEKKIMDYTINVEEANFGSDLKLVDKNPLSLELYLYDKKAYVLLQNFYENYIYTDIEEYDSLFDGISQNDINYQLLIAGLRSSLQTGIKATAKTQTVGNVTIDGKNTKANIISVSLNKTNQKVLYETTLNSLKNNQAYISEYAKLSNSKEEDIKAEFDEMIKEATFDKDAGKIEFYTGLFDGKLIGIRYNSLTEDKEILNIIPIANGVKVTYHEKEQEKINISYSKVVENTSTKKTTTSNIDLTLYDDKNVIKGTINFVLSQDVNPKVEKVNTKNSVDARYISTEDQQKILNNIQNYGSLGLILENYIGSLTPSVNTNDVINGEANVSITDEDLSF